MLRLALGSEAALRVAIHSVLRHCEVEILIVFGFSSRNEMWPADRALWKLSGGERLRWRPEAAVWRLGVRQSFALPA